MGNQLYHHAWGIDLSEMGAPYLAGQISYGKSQVLMRDYETRQSVLTVILEMCKDVAMRTRVAGKVGRTIHLGIGYSRNSFGGGFSRSKSIHEANNDATTIYNVYVDLFDKFYDHRPVRNVSISITNLESETSMQLNLFEEDKWQNRKLAAAMDDIRKRFGSTAILRGVSLTKDGTAIKRSKLVGGHKG